MKAPAPNSPKRVFPGAVRRAVPALVALLCCLPALGRSEGSVVWSRPMDGYGVFSVAALDLNHDGHSDLLIGVSRGAVAYFGSKQGLSKKPDWSYLDLPVGGVGFCVGSAGHLNGDPFPVIYVSAPRVGGRGAVYLFRTGPKGPEAKPWKVLWSPDPGEGFGERVAFAGDLYGDGYDDLAVGDFSYGQQTGKVYVYRGGPQGPGPDPSWSAQGEHRGDWFGYSMCGPGDLDHDGYDDLVIGSKNCNGSCLAWMQDNPDLLLNQDIIHSANWAKAAVQPTAGRMSVFYGSKRGPGAKPGLVMEGTTVHELFAYDVERAGDLNKDGHACILVGSMGWKDNRGLVQLFEGGDQGHMRELWKLEGSQADEGLGFRQRVVEHLSGPGSRALVLDGLGVDEDWLLEPFMEPAGTLRQRHLLQGAPTKARFSPDMGSAGDIYGDGKNEVYVETPGQKGALEVIKY